MIRAMRQVLPPRWSIALFVFLYLLLSAPALLLYMLEVWFDDPILQAPHYFVLLGCFFYGLYRVLAFHPAYRPAYRKWLMASPWTARLPLPMGPIHLVWQDGVVLLVAEILLWRSPYIPATYPALAILIPYLFALADLLMITGLPRTACYILIGLGGLIHLVEHPVWALVIVVGIYLVAYIALRRSLTFFPWTEAEVSTTTEKFQQWLAKPNQPLTPQLTWPFNRLRPVDPKPMISVETAAWLSLLVGWYTHVLLIFGIMIQLQPPNILLFIYGIIVVPIGRVFLYCALYWPPISVLGRIFTLRWIIPDYDHVFVAPICAVITGTTVYFVLSHLWIPVQISLPIAISLTLLLTLSMGPTLGSWRLTGSHRISPGLADGKNFIKI